jgi:hypothetical protein
VRDGAERETEEARGGIEKRKKKKRNIFVCIQGRKKKGRAQLAVAAVNNTSAGNFSCVGYDNKNEMTQHQQERKIKKKKVFPSFCWSFYVRQTTLPPFS